MGVVLESVFVVESLSVPSVVVIGIDCVSSVLSLVGICVIVWRLSCCKVVIAGIVISPPDCPVSNTSVGDNDVPASGN